MVMSSLPSTTTTLIGGKLSSLFTPYRSTTARKEFLSNSKQMCDLREKVNNGLTLHRDHLQMARDVGECQIFRAEELDWGTLEECIVILAYEPSIL